MKYSYRGYPEELLLKYFCFLEGVERFSVPQVRIGRYVYTYVWIGLQLIHFISEAFGGARIDYYLTKQMAPLFDESWKFLKVEKLTSVCPVRVEHANHYTIGASYGMF